MELIPLETCSRALEFTTREPWPKEFPAFAWNGHLLTGFERTGGHALNFPKESPFIKLVHACYKKLEIDELAALWLQLKNLPVATEQQREFFSFYNLHDNETLRETLRLFLKMGPSFRSWAGDRKVGPGELAILRSFTSHNWVHLMEVGESIAKLMSSRRTGAEILEVAGELSLSGVAALEIQRLDSETAETWLERLIRLRNPVASAKLADKNKSLQNLPWPKQTSGRWVRHGDQDNLEIKMVVKSDQEIEKRIEQLKAVQSKLREIEAHQWKN